MLEKEMEYSTLQLGGRIVQHPGVHVTAGAEVWSHGEAGGNRKLDHTGSTHDQICPEELSTKAKFPVTDTLPGLACHMPF